MSRITVKQLIEILSKFDPDLEVWEELDTGFSPLDIDPREGVLEDHEVALRTNKGASP